GQTTSIAKQFAARALFPPCRQIISRRSRLRRSADHNQQCLLDLFVRSSRAGHRSSAPPRSWVRHDEVVGHRAQWNASLGAHGNPSTAATPHPSQLPPPRVFCGNVSPPVDSLLRLMANCPLRSSPFRSPWPKPNRPNNLGLL